MPGTVLVKGGDIKKNVSVSAPRLSQFPQGDIQTYIASVPDQSTHSTEEGVAKYSESSVVHGGFKRPKRMSRKVPGMEREEMHSRERTRASWGMAETLK